MRQQERERERERDRTRQDRQTRQSVNCTVTVELVILQSSPVFRSTLSVADERSCDTPAFSSSLNKVQAFLRMSKFNNKGPSEGLKGVTQLLMTLVGAPRPPAPYKTNKISQDYKIRKGYKPLVIGQIFLSKDPLRQ